MPAKVRDSQNDRAIGFDDEEHAEWKSMEDGTPDLTKDDGEALGPFVNSRKGRPQFVEEFRPEVCPFAFVPRSCVERVELCLWPNGQPRHLPPGAETLLYAFDDFFPGPRFAGCPTMFRETFL